MTASLYAPGPGGVARRPLDRLLHLLLPAGCLACARPLPAAGSPLGLCAGCRRRLKPPAAPDAPDAGRARGAGALDRLLALWSYEPPLDAVVAGLKFRRLDYLGGHLAAALAEGLAGELAAAAERRRAGAAPLAPPARPRLQPGRAHRPARSPPRLGLPFAAALARARPTPAQTSLGRAERLANLRRRLPRPARRLAPDPGPRCCWSTTWRRPGRRWRRPPRRSGGPAPPASPPWSPAGRPAGERMRGRSI